MYINKISNTQFSAGNVHIKKMNIQNPLKCYEALKKLAEEKNIDISITKNKDSIYLPHEDIYLVVASKEIPVVAREFFPMGKLNKHGTNVMILSKNATKEELSTKIFNAAMKAIETLEEKLLNKKEGL